MAHWDVRKGWNRNKMEEIKRHVGKKKKKSAVLSPPLVRSLTSSKIMGMLKKIYGQKRERECQRI